LYRYEKDHQTLLNFAVLARKNGKNAPFNMKSPEKKIFGRVKGEKASQLAPLKYATGYVQKFLVFTY